MTMTMAERRLPEEAEREFKNLIDGEWVAAESGETFSCVDPFTEEAWGRVPIAGEADVDRAVRAARRAFDSDGWPQTSPAERAALMRRLLRLSRVQRPQCSNHRRMPRLGHCRTSSHIAIG